MCYDYVMSYMGLDELIPAQASEISYLYCDRIFFFLKAFFQYVDL